jgi:hypothetical protein
LIALRALRVIGRWVLWCTMAWASYYFARLAVSLVRFPAPPRVRALETAFLFEGIVFFIATIVVLSAVIAMLLVVPYAFIVARRPLRRFWGEAAPVGRVVVWIAAIFVPVGLISGALTPRATTTVNMIPRTSVSGGYDLPDPTKQRP